MTSHSYNLYEHDYDPFIEKPASSDYWKTPEGISKRIEMLGEEFTYGITNGSLQVYGTDYGASAFMWVTHPEDSKTHKVCDICAPRHGHIYRSGQFLPSMPAHANCKCKWVILWR